MAVACSMGQRVPAFNQGNLARWTVLNRIREGMRLQRAPLITQTQVPFLFGNPPVIYIAQTLIFQLGIREVVNGHVQKDSGARQKLSVSMLQIAA